VRARPEELNTPGFAKDIQRITIRMSVSQNLAEGKKESLRVHAGQHHHYLAGGLIGDVEEGMRITTGTLTRSPAEASKRLPFTSYK
jgi:hypothetical protein